MYSRRPNILCVFCGEPPPASCGTLKFTLPKLGVLAATAMSKVPPGVYFPGMSALVTVDMNGAVAPPYLLKKACTLEAVRARSCGVGTKEMLLALLRTRVNSVLW